MTGRVVRLGHVCAKPGTLDYPRDTVWQCDCGRLWLLTKAGWRETSEVGVAMIRLNDRLVAARRKAGMG